MADFQHFVGPDLDHCLVAECLVAVFVADDEVVVAESIDMQNTWLVVAQHTCQVVAVVVAHAVIEMRCYQLLQLAHCLPFHTGLNRSYHSVDLDLDLPGLTVGPYRFDIVVLYHSAFGSHGPYHADAIQTGHHRKQQVNNDVDKVNRQLHRVSQWLACYRAGTLDTCSYSQMAAHSQVAGNLGIGWACSSMDNMVHWRMHAVGAGLEQQGYCQQLKCFVVRPNCLYHGYTFHASDKSMQARWMENGAAWKDRSIPQQRVELHYYTMRNRERMSLGSCYSLTGRWVLDWGGMSMECYVVHQQFDQSFAVEAVADHTFAVPT